MRECHSLRYSICDILYDHRSFLVCHTWHVSLFYKWPSPHRHFLYDNECVSLRVDVAGLAGPCGAEWRRLCSSLLSKDLFKLELTTLTRKWGAYNLFSTAKFTFWNLLTSGKNAMPELFRSGANETEFPPLSFRGFEICDIPTTQWFSFGSER